MKKSYVIANIIITVIVIVWNSIAGSRGVNGKTVGELSDEYNNLFTPAGYAFAIWSVIFILLALHVGYQYKKVFIDKNDDGFVLKIGPWFFIANLMNCLWLIMWLYEYTALSVLVMTVLLLSLLYIVRELKLNINSNESKSFRWLVSVPIGVYTGWISVAIIANIASYFSKMGFSPITTEFNWAIIMIIIASAINIYMVLKRNLISFGAVGIWALVAIFVRFQETTYSGLGYFALVASVVILIAAIYQGSKLIKSR